MKYDGPKLEVVVGGQYGSESKGRVAAWAVQTNPHPNVISVRVAGPNAGHVVVNPKTGNKHALRCLPVGLVSRENAIAYIAPGSEVNLTVLQDEINMLRNDGIELAGRVYAHNSATLLEQVHIDHENSSDLTARSGSTSKGIGAARAERIWRNARTIADVSNDLSLMGVNTVDGHWLQDQLHAAGTAAVIEGTQGYGLGLHTDNYPQTTSSDCRAIDFLAMAGVSPWTVSKDQFKIHVVLRVYPIRVAGNSGPIKSETSWDELGLKEEYTTVTKRVRRVGEWDAELAREALAANGLAGAGTPNVVVALAMLDQKFPEVANRDRLSPAAKDFVDQIGHDLGAHIDSIGTGPNTTITRSDNRWKLTHESHLRTERKVADIKQRLDDIDAKIAKGVDSADLWRDLTEQDIQDCLTKLAEYGAHDLEIMGESFVGDHRNVTNLVPSEKAILIQEAAIAFYALGKATRLMAAYKRGEAGSDDSWKDLVTYGMMARVLRKKGNL